MVRAWRPNQGYATAERPSDASAFRLGRLRYGHADSKHRAGAVATVLRLDPAALRFDKAAADRQTKPSAGALPILGVDAIEDGDVAR